HVFVPSVHLAELRGGDVTKQEAIVSQSEVRDRKQNLAGREAENSACCDDDGKVALAIAEHALNRSDLIAFGVEDLATLELHGLQRRGRSGGDASCLFASDLLELDAWRAVHGFHDDLRLADALVPNVGLALLHRNVGKMPRKQR